MKKRNQVRNIVIGALTPVLLMSYSLPVFAEDGERTPTPSASQSSEVLAAKCAEAKTKLGNRLVAHEKVYANHVERYTKITTKLTALSTDLKAKGVDTTTLDADINLFQQKVLAIGVAFDAYKAAVTAAQAAPCVRSSEKEKGLSQEMLTVRKTFKAVKTSITSARKFLSTTIIARDIKKKKTELQTRRSKDIDDDKKVEASATPKVQETETESESND